jgi:23S rRNA pseudouridine1911/1915/1917 synthase
MKLSDKENLFNIQYVDNHIIVVFKEANLLTQPNKMNTINLEDLIKNWIKDKYNKKNNVFLHPIHRLDKEVSGLVVFARTSKALSRLNKQMRLNKIKRKYIAEIEGKLEKKEGELKDYILHLSHRAKIIKNPIKKAKLAHLSYKMIKEKKDSSIVEIELFTGRYHQIRAQFANISHPILGDKKYSSKIGLKKIRLVCFYLSFFHPVKEEEMKFKTDFFE